jgi:Tfp pilus assembly protein PilF
MPFTFNGVGTRYAGRGNLSVVEGNCLSCGRFTRLSSFDTREFFCVLYIPLIPLRKFRIQQHCSVCRRHRRIPFEQFQQDLSQQIEPLREEARRSPTDATPHIRLVERLLDFQMSAEALQAARDGLAAQPRNARLNLLAGELTVLSGDATGAGPFYRQAVASAPNDAAIRAALGRHLLARGETAEAARELEQAQRLDPGDAQVSNLLGQALARDQRWAEALNAFQQAATRDPRLAADRDLLRRTAECKRALGYPLADEERKALRRFWPFGRSGKTAPRKPIVGRDPKRIVILLGLVLGGIVVYFTATALWKQSHGDVYFDNALRRPLQVTVDGETFELPANLPVEKTLGTGKHVVQVSGGRKEIERATIEIPRMDFLDAIAEHRFFVYDVAAARTYKREEIGYSGLPADRTYKATLIGLQRFFEEDGVDYVFEKAPDSIQVDAGASAVVKVAFNGTDLDFNQLGVAWNEEGKTREAERAFRKAVETEGCSSHGHGNLIQLLLNEKQPDQGLAEARKWIADCPDSGVVPHRAYQNALLKLDRGEELEKEYKARLDAHPEVGANHYLYARLFNDPARTLPLYREAVRLDPSLSWAQAALGLDLLKVELDAEAADHLESSIKAPDHEPSFAVNYAEAAIGAGLVPHAEEALNAAPKLGGEVAAAELWKARWLLKLAAGKYDEAERLLRRRTPEGEPDEEETWELRLQLAHLRGDSAEVTKLLLAGKRWPDNEGRMCALQMERALETGDYAEAVRIVDAAKTDDSTVQLYAAAAQLMEGDRKAAETRLAAVEASFGTSWSGNLFLARYLRGEVKLESALAYNRRAGFETLPHAYFMFGARAAADGDAAKARAWFEKSRATALDLDFPYFAAAGRAKN